MAITTYSIIHMRRIVNVLVFMLLFITVACNQTIENEDINIPKINLTGNWTVNAYIDSSLIFGPFTIATRMTTKNDSLYIKDNGEFWNFQVKAKSINSSNTFKTKASVNEISSLGAKINILNGRVINNTSIAFDIQFQDDETPYGFTYTLKGHRK